MFLPSDLQFNWRLEISDLTEVWKKKIKFEIWNLKEASIRFLTRKVQQIERKRACALLRRIWLNFFLFFLSSRFDSITFDFLSFFRCFDEKLKTTYGPVLMVSLRRPVVCLSVCMSVCLFVRLSDCLHFCSTLSTEKRMNCSGQFYDLWENNNLGACSIKQIFLIVK